MMKSSYRLEASFQAESKFHKRRKKVERIWIRGLLSEVNKQRKKAFSEKASVHVRVRGRLLLRDWLGLQCGQSHLLIYMFSVSRGKKRGRVIGQLINISSVAARFKLWKVNRQRVASWWSPSTVWRRRVNGTIRQLMRPSGRSGKAQRRAASLSSKASRHSEATETCRLLVSLEYESYHVHLLGFLHLLRR